MYFGTAYEDAVLVVTIRGHLGAIWGPFKAIRRPLRRRPENGVKSASNQLQISCWSLGMALNGC